MSTFLNGLWVVLGLELRQRVRGVAWYVLLGIFVIVVGIVTVTVWFITAGFTSDESEAGGASIYSAVIYFVLLLGTLVAPALSGNAINGDRDAGSLATTQVTLITSGQIVVGKFLAAWITALAFLVASTPFILFASVVGGLQLDTFAASVLVLAAELGVVAAIGVGLSGLLSRPLFSVVVTYLVVAALSIGTLIAFSLGGLAIRSEQVSTSYYATTYDDVTGQGTTCATEPEVYRSPVPRFDYFWGVLAANPYVVLADAAPTHLTRDGQPEDLFGFIKLGIRQSQIAPDLSPVFDECDPATYESSYPSPTEVLESTVPSWFVGLLVHIVLAAAALWGAWRRLRTPARRLGAGSRIA